MELNSDDAVSMDGSVTFKAGQMFKVKQLYTAAMNYVGDPHGNWFRDKGLACEVLETEGGGWQKGRILFRVEFIPDNPPAIKPPDPNSPLADLRSNLDI